VEIKMTAPSPQTKTVLVAIATTKSSKMENNAPKIKHVNQDIASTGFAME
jgi:hypothetical protein